MDLKAIVEALVFASDFPLALDRLHEFFKDQGVERRRLLEIIEELKGEYDARRGGILFKEVAGGYTFRTRPDAAVWIRRFRAAKPLTISAAALETLAVVAYRQPVIKAEIDKVRGVDSGGVLKGLLEKRLVRILGRKDVPGRPIIYGTTKKFLDVFNLRDLNDLPTLEELRGLQRLGNE